MRSAGKEKENNLRKRFLRLYTRPPHLFTVGSTNAFNSRRIVNCGGAAVGGGIGQLLFSHQFLNEFPTFSSLIVSFTSPQVINLVLK